jgi:hypothetical protein
MFLDILSYFDILWTTKERTDNRIIETIYGSRVHGSLNCHRHVAKQINPLQVDNLITNKSLTILEASRILNTQCVRTYVLANVKNFEKHEVA